MPAPEEVVVSKSLNKFAGVCGCKVYIGAVFAFFMNKPIDTAMLFVAQISFVSITFSGFKTSRRGVMLHDEVVPIDDPYISIGAYFCNDG